MTARKKGAAAKKAPAQPKLPGTSPTRRRGVVERAAGADLSKLRDLEVMPDGTAALQDAYRLLAREMDRAESERDRYGKINTARELRNLRQNLAPVTAASGAMTIEDILDGIPD